MAGFERVPLRRVRPSAEVQLSSAPSGLSHVPAKRNSENQIMKSSEKMLSGENGDLAHENTAPSIVAPRECISPGEFVDAADEAGLPKAVRKIRPCTVEIYRIVADLKTLRHRGEPAGKHWSWLRCVLDTAAESDDWSAFDDFAQAWKLAKVNHRKLGHEFSKSDHAPVREPAKLAVVNAVTCLQLDLERLPYRKEILDFINVELGRGMDDTELSRQLKILGWAERIPYAQGALRPTKKILEPAPLTPEKLASSNYFRRLAGDSQTSSGNENAEIHSSAEKLTVASDDQLSE